jgi:hypothetical protein
MNKNTKAVYIVYRKSNSVNGPVFITAYKSIESAQKCANVSADRFVSRQMVSAMDPTWKMAVK